MGPALAIEQQTAFALDLFGHGESDRPFDADFGIAAQSDYVERALAALRIARAALVGVDLGGGVAIRLAATRPERVARLVLINTLAFDQFPGEDVRSLQRNTARLALRISRGLFGAAPLLTPLLKGSVADPERMSPRLVARYLAPFVGREGVVHLLALARAIRADDLAELDLGGIDVPTMILWGDKDQWIDPGIGDRLASAIPGSQLVRFPDYARLVPEEAPERVSELITDFVWSRSTSA